MDHESVDIQSNADGRSRVMTLKSVLSGSLISLGVVGFLTGLLLVPLGVWLAVSAKRTGRLSWPAFVIGLGVGPVLLLWDDLTKADPPKMAVPVFCVGVVLLIGGAITLVWRGAGDHSPN